MAEQTTRDLKLVQYLNEAYGKEKELETALQAHIAMTTKAPYKKRLQQHLKETKGTRPPGGAAHQAARRQGGARAGPGRGRRSGLGGDRRREQGRGGRQGAAARAARHRREREDAQERQDRVLERVEEIATYTAIETLADTVGDKETAKLARGIRREEERMAKFLEGQIPQLAKAVAREEIPAAERRTQRRRRVEPARAAGRVPAGSRSS